MPFSLAILVGGLGTFSGPFIGVGIFMLFGELVVSYGRMAEMAILVITIVYLLYAPKYTPWGIMGIYRKIRQKIPIQQMGNDYEKRTGRYQSS